MSTMSAWGWLARTMFGNLTEIPPRDLSDGNFVEIKSCLRRWRIRRECEQNSEEKPSLPEESTR